MCLFAFLLSLLSPPLPFVVVVLTCCASPYTLSFLSVESPSLASVSSSIVTASVALYRWVEVEMLPTPSKSHYTFNLRDLSKVFQV